MSTGNDGIDVKARREGHEVNVMEKCTMMQSMRGGLLCGAVRAAAVGAFAGIPARASDPVDPVDPAVHGSAPDGLRFEMPFGVYRSGDVREQKSATS